MTNFKDQVIAKLSPEHEFIRLYAKSNLKTIVETRSGGRLINHTLQKLDIKSLFVQAPVFEVEPDATHDDLYQLVSERYNLGLEKGIDYYNAEPLYPSNLQKYVSLLVLSDSYGYYGEIPVYYTRIGYSLNGELLERDLSNIDQQYVFRLNKARAFFVSSVFKTEDMRNSFIGNRLSHGLIASIVNKAKEDLDLSIASVIKSQLISGTVKALLTDNLSDILLFQCPNGVELLIRFTSGLDDLPDLNFISTGNGNILSDDPQGLLLGEEEQVSEKPGGKEEGVYISGYGVTQHNTSLSLQEDNPVEETPVNNGLVIDEIEEDIIVYLDPKTLV